MQISSSTYPKALSSLRLWLMALSLFLPLTLAAQTSGKILIDGAVYGGGASAAINIDNAIPTNALLEKDGTPKTSEDKIGDCLLETLGTDEATDLAATVNVYDGTIGSVFGGGAMGRTFGMTKVTMQGANVLVRESVFGAGEGKGAGVLGGSEVVMINGKVAGSIYGGADEARTVGSTRVEIKGGSAIRSVFGGSRVANVYGNTFVFLNGAEAQNDILVGSVYGGNDVSGVISPVPNTVPAEGADGYDLKLTQMHTNWTWALASATHRPTEVSNALTVAITDDAFSSLTEKAALEEINDSWNAFIYTNRPDDDSKMVQVQNLFVGGNGDYDYTTSPYDIYKDKKPELTRGFVLFTGGSCGNLYGGGNNATITERTDICLFNKTDITKYTFQDIDESGDPKEGTQYTRNYQFGNVFGGNNKAEMSIRPNWYLQEASIENLYSGGNAGNMTYVSGLTETAEGSGKYKAKEAGLILAIESPDMTVKNVFGGCRMADVNPGGKGRDLVGVAAETAYGYKFQPNYAARVIIKDGNITNVYGGNDVTGIVYQGSQVEIHHSVSGDVYGAGNGSYPYIEKRVWDDLTNDKTGDDLTAAEAKQTSLKDYAFDPLAVYNNRKGTTLTSLTSFQKVQALNLLRPDAKQVYVHVKGNTTEVTGDGLDAEGNPAKVTMTYIGGSLYLGGNSATLATLEDDLENVKSHLQIGNYVVAKDVFLGSNGANMVTSDVLKSFKQNIGWVDGEDLASTTKYNINGVEAADGEESKTLFDLYMKGVEVAVLPTIEFDSDYKPFRSGICSLYLGGNVGSMTSPKQFTFDFNKKISIYNKLVAGCNNANVHIQKDGETPLNAFHLGGIVTPMADPSLPKVKLELSNLRLNPQRLVKTGSGYTLMPYYYYQDLLSYKDLELTVDDPRTLSTELKAKYDALIAEYGEGSHRVRKYGNVYGGCFESGYVNGGVQIDVTANSVYDKDIYSPDNYFPQSAFDVLSSRLSIYGGGYGEDSEIWGDVIINVTEQGQILKVFGGGEQGIVGKMHRNPDTGEYMEMSAFGDSSIPKYIVDEKHDTHVNVYGRLNQAGDYYDVMRVYGGGYEGLVTGDTHVAIDDAMIHTAFGGACNADIYGSTELIVGESGAPKVTNNLYGGNDFGGRILGSKSYAITNSHDRLIPDRSMNGTTRLYPEEQAPEKVYTQTYVEYHQGIVDGNIFGGSCGDYKYAINYTDIFNVTLGTDGSINLTRKDARPFYLPNMTLDPYSQFVDAGGNPITVDRSKELAVNSFVNVVSTSSDASTAAIKGGNITTYRFKTDANGDYVKVDDKRVKDEYTGHVGGIFGGGQGCLGHTKVADQMGSYVRLASLDSRTVALASRVFGAGYCSNTDVSLVDAFTGNFTEIFGGCYGMTYEERLFAAEEAVNRKEGESLTDTQKNALRINFLYAIYGGGKSTVRLHDMENTNMDIFGGGANAGSNESLVELYAGKAHDIYGATLDEGYTCASVVVVPEGSTSQVNAIFGGAKAKDHKYMCDVSNAFISFKSADARVADNIYGGNNQDRFTRSTQIVIDKPVHRTDEELADVYGGGKGSKSVISFSNVALNNGAKVANVYGGGYDGQVQGSPFLRAYCLDENELIPYYDVEEAKWKIYKGESRYFSDDVYSSAQTLNYINVPVIEQKYSPRTYIKEGSYTGDDVVTTYTVGSSTYTEIKSPVWDRFLTEVKNGNVKLGDETLTLDNLKGKLNITDTGDTYYTYWPGFTKYKYSPQTKAYHAWTLKQQAVWGRYAEQVFQPDRGIPGETGYVSEQTKEYIYPAYRAKGFDVTAPLYELGQETFLQNNSKIRLYEGSEVQSNVYGGGYGEDAVVAGNTDVRLLGGVVKGNIYGGGNGGDVRPLPSVRVYDSEILTAHTTVLLGAGSVTNSYGGGYKGNVYGFAETSLGYELKGDAFGSTSSTTGIWRNSEYEYFGVWEEAKVSGDVFTPRTLVGGDPCVERSLYGGGEKGKVDCMANLTINQGHVGFKIELPTSKPFSDLTATEKANCYSENTDLDAPGDKKLAYNGNVFGGGYGAGAVTFFPSVMMYGGTIRNSLYGGGEIASVGEGPSSAQMAAWKAQYEGKENGGAQMAALIGKELRDPAKTSASLGHTHVVVMGGNVRGDVFGGGRGYTYGVKNNYINGDVDEDGVPTDPSTRRYSDGYVFGNTSVHIRGGEVGTLTTLADNKGNVFGGGDEGFIYTSAVKCTKDSSDPYYSYQSLLTGTSNHYIADRYYTNKWECQNCKTITRSYLEPHACWACQKHEMPSAIEDYTEFKQVNVVKEGTEYVPELVLAEDARVVVSPYSRVDPEKDGITITTPGTSTDRLFGPGRYIPTSYLNQIAENNDPRWGKMDGKGVTIHNAVFAGGNASTGSDRIFANATTVYGNGTAALNDVFTRDFISLGHDGIGGLYGDGNYTFVDGYRELNITNYGTDFYNLSQKIEIDQYNELSDREKDYYELKYKCKTACTISGKTYAVGDEITADDYIKLTDEQKAYFEVAGFVTIYAGRMMNTIQRADFCGVFGSRIVLEGAADRVVDQVDYKLYTINRLGELSLNQTTCPTDPATTHGNYFGMYGIVNYLGGLTSDVDFNSVRETENTDDSKYKCAVEIGATTYPYGKATYAQWKQANLKQRIRNNGSSANKVALAMGVFLELVKEPAATNPDKENKDYGYITGVVELDLINVATGAGGGYVYAKNEHGQPKNIPTGDNLSHTNLSEFNANARTNLLYTYDSDNLSEMETSGNFVHSTKQIVDDCYPNIGVYSGNNASAAHYWYLKGDYYVYDQYLSAYTGSNTAYTASVDLPLTITLGSRGKLNLVNIQPNLYAFYDKTGKTPLSSTVTKSVEINGVTYKPNDVITYWAYSLLSDEEKRCFVPQTYVAVKDFNFTVAGSPDVTYSVEKGTVFIYNSTTESISIPNHEGFPATISMSLAAVEGLSGRGSEGEGGSGSSGESATKVSDFVCISNEVSHNKGYAVSVDFNNPAAWDGYYRQRTGNNVIGNAVYQGISDTDKATYAEAPTYKLKGTGGKVLGQMELKIGDVIARSIQTSYETNKLTTSMSAAYNALTDQASIENCYVALEDVIISDVVYQKGSTISASVYNNLSDTGKMNFEPAYVCTSTCLVPGTTNDYVFTGNVISSTRYQEIVAAYKAGFAADAQPTDAQVTAYMGIYFDEASICVKIDDDADSKVYKYGGNYFAPSTNYTALESWSALSYDERVANFTYNYDALDIISMSDETKETPGGTTDHDGADYGMYPGFINADNHNIDKMGIYDYGQILGSGKGPWNIEQPIDYQAVYKGTSTTIKYDSNGDGTLDATIDPSGTDANKTLTREQYESIPNEQVHYSAITITNDDKSNGLYIVKELCWQGERTYVPGQKLTKAEYDGLNNVNINKVTSITLNPAIEVGTKFYVCREAYKVESAANGGKAIHPFDLETNAYSTTSYASSAIVPVGTIIKNVASETIESTIYNGYPGLVNNQKDFTILGKSPAETTTLYVASDADINKLSTERVISVIYQYKYEETDDSDDIEQIVERHIINVHLEFKSGVPTIGPLDAPPMVLPGSAVGLKQPTVTEGAYKIIGGGWEYFLNQSDAEEKRNGKEFLNNAERVYWYQNGKYVAYYAKTYLGKAYSNAVPLRVANYHDIADVLNHSDYMYVDRPDVLRKSKIYIDNAHKYKKVDGKYVIADGEDDVATTYYSKLDMLNDIFKTSLATSTKTVTTQRQQWDSGTQTWKDLYYTDEGKTTTTTTVTDWPVYDTTDQTKLDSHTRNCNNLEFFFNSDVEMLDPDNSSPIGNATDGCFSGVVHGMGHTISGLKNSLFGSLCGNVYNLGVTGSFTTAGIADDSADKYTSFGCSDEDTDKPTETDYSKKDVTLVANCWILTDGTAAKTKNPVFNYSSTTTSPSGHRHIINCYYPTVDDGVFNNYTNPDDQAYARPLKAFYNGEVAYNLNGFYLVKRYANKEWTGTAAGSQNYKYLDYYGTDGVKLKGADATVKDGHYLVAEGPGNVWYPSYSYDADAATFLYVERQWIDGDMVYRYGKIPLTDDVRLHGSYYRPIWPDDYMFFGQSLGYGYYDDTFTGMPTAVMKSEEGILDRTDKNNIVHRAPAYFRGVTEGTNGFKLRKDKVYFNDRAAFAAEVNSSDNVATTLRAKPLHSGLLAIDLTGADDSRWNLRYETTAADDPNYFYPPMLDILDNEADISEVRTNGLTQNLLTYAPQSKAVTLTSLNKYFKELDLIVGNTYREVGKFTDAQKQSVNGHVVIKIDDSHYVAADNHLLIDAQDFYAPIAYNMGEENRMWYQRVPDNCVDDKKGWEAVSLPFKTELVSAQTKGEITHFYKKAGSTAFERGYDSGHEYWLREFTGTKASDDPAVTTALMNYPSQDVPPTAADKTDANTFLWDYYYQKFEGNDKNEDTYQQSYYQSSREYPGYPYAAAATPYIIGFPGERYYEFDLSGKWKPENTQYEINALGDGNANLAITFVSDLEADIAASYEATGVTFDGYAFMPNYLNVDASGAATGETYYLLNQEGSKFLEAVAANAVPANPEMLKDLKVAAFRPYFKTASSKQLKSSATRSIVFSMGDGSQLGETEPIIDQDTADAHNLRIYAKKGKIIVESMLSHDIDVTITNVAGQLFDSYTIEPDERVETPIQPGVYIVNRTKLIVK